MAIFSGIAASLTLFAWNVLGLTSLAAAGAFASITLGIGLLGVQSVIGGMMQPSLKTPQAQAVINQATGPRIRGYGRALLGGTRAFWDSKNGFLYQVVMMHSGEIDMIEQFRVGDIRATVDSNGHVTNPSLVTGNTNVRIFGHLGSPNQSANSFMMDNWAGVWTNNHRLRGIAYFVTRFRSPSAEDFQKVYPDGPHTPVRALCRLSRVWDPRNDNSVWSDNSALCILDYLTHPDGYRLTIDDVDLNSFALFANLCDENVPLAAGGTEKRYRLWGVYQLTEEPHAVLRKMLNTCDGELYQTAEGKVAIRGGKWEAPTLTLSPEGNLGHSMDQGNNRFAAFNELKIMYTSPQHDYQSMEATAWRDLADQAERGPIVSDLDLDFVPSPTQARRLAKIHQAKANPRWKGKIQHNIYGLNALGERTVRVILPELEIDDAFYVAGIRPSPDLASVEIDVMSISQAAYDWTTAEEGTNPPIPADTAPDLEFPIPQNLVLSNPDSGVVFATVDAPGREGLTLEVQIRAGAGGNWITMDTESQTTARETGLADGDYQARARWLGPQNVVSEWSFPLAEITIPV
jgi:hypothetical protein